MTDKNKKPETPPEAKDEREVEIIPGCIVCKACEFHAPDVFEVKEKALVAIVINKTPAKERIPDVLEAAKRCPEHVIKFRKKKVA